ncbi:MAG: putative protein ninG [Prokaryotic dsDNA virus sp.]|nr:MAG: putative protein ninG [Prokaryotic dsDNA virus sp.]|tara:strand:+ start:3452 stop:3853 length:402 start_codon:yes stop_codon:yes gene_type:complete
MKTKTISKLKKELDKIFSIYIRTRYADDNGMVECWTCSVKKHYKEMHAGHFMSRKHLPTRFHEDNVQVQCPKCNLFGQGEQYAFGKLLDIRIKEGLAEHLQTLSKARIKFTRSDYLEMIEEYKEKLELLKNNC